jgi:PadR family transcriptional regulator, regulatory protein PadR
MITMKAENTKAQMRKGILEYCILEIISKKNTYAPDIIEEMRKAKMLVVEGTIYPILTRLKNAGILNYRWEESQQGPPRKYYEITPEGNEVLKDLRISWTEITKAVEYIINN